MFAFSRKELLKKINEKKSELLKVVSKNGLNSELTIRCSQELDKLILFYQKHYSTHTPRKVSKAS